MVIAIRWQTFPPTSPFADCKICVVSLRLEFYVDTKLSFSFLAYSLGVMIKMSFPTPRLSSGDFVILIHLLNTRVGEGSLSLSFILPHWPAVPAAAGEQATLYAGRGSWGFSP